MGNHYHLIIETVEGNLSAGMRQLNGVHTQAVNRHHRRVGHVFQGRYKAILVERDSYLLELSRYVVLNPVRAKIVKHASQWPWSSYHATNGTAPCPEWLETDWLLSQFGTQPKRQIERYVEFVRQGVRGMDMWAQLKGQVYLGGDEFVEAMRQRLEADVKFASQEIPRAQRRALAKSLNYYQSGFGDAWPPPTPRATTRCKLLRIRLEYIIQRLVGK